MFYRIIKIIIFYILLFYRTYFDGIDRVKNLDFDVIGEPDIGRRK